MKTMKASLIFGKKQIILASLVLILSAAVYLNWQFANKEQGLDSVQTSGLKDAPTITDMLPDDETGLPVEQTGTDININAEDPVAVTGKDSDKSNVNGTGDVKNTVDNTNAAATQGTAEKDKEASADTESGKNKNLGDALLVNAKTVADETYFAMARLSRSKANDTAVETLAGFLKSDNLSEADKKDLSSKALALTDKIEAENRIENLIMAKGFADCVVYLTDDTANVVVKCDALTQDSATQIKNIIVSEGKISGEKVSITEIN